MPLERLDTIEKPYPFGPGYYERPFAEKLEALTKGFGPIACDDLGMIPRSALDIFNRTLRPLGVRVTTDPLKPHVDLATHTLNLEAIR